MRPPVQAAFVGRLFTTRRFLLLLNGLLRPMLMHEEPKKGGEKPPFFIVLYWDYRGFRGGRPRLRTGLVEAGGKPISFTAAINCWTSSKAEYTEAKRT